MNPIHSLSRRDLVTMAGSSLAFAAVPAIASQAGSPAPGAKAGAAMGVFNIRDFGATGDGKTLDSPAINRAIDAAAAAGGGTVYFPAGVYASYSIRLKSHITLYLDQGAVILAESTPHDGLSSGGYDAAEPQGEWEPYQDYGHNHWHNSLIWGEGLNDLAILGQGLIWGKGLSRGWGNEEELPDSGKPGVGNKAIALKNCHNVTLRDFSILQGGWFGLLATGADNLTVDNLLIDTNRDGMDFDCCKNVHVSNCTVNSPWDDAICPKSSYALGYPRVTENVTITNCMVTGNYQIGSVLDGTWKPHPTGVRVSRTGRIKLGTESNGGFKSITIANCIFEGSHGLALETVDGALVEDIAVTNITMRDSIGSPFFLRLGARLRGPKESTKVGTLKRIVMTNITSYGATPLCSQICGMQGQMIEDIKIGDVYLHQVGGVNAEGANLRPPERDQAYPEPSMFGDLPATGLFVRHARNLEVSNLEVMTEAVDARPAFWLTDVDGADFFRIKIPRNGTAPAFRLLNVNEFRVFGSKYVKDAAYARSEDNSF